jgi:hypothetical protein
MTSRERPAVVLGISCLAILLAAADAPGQREKQVVSLFEKRVEAFRQFFAARPKALIKVALSTSPSGFVVRYRRIESATVSHDLQKTNSLTSPYAGSITVNYGSSDSRRCGPFEVQDDRFFLTVESARQSRDDESCYVRQTVDGEEYRTSTKFVFALENKKWVFKEALGKDGTPDPLFAPLVGKAGTEWSTLEDNAFFRKLIQ